MKSRWFHLKSEACELRLTGLSIGEIEKRLEIPRSTLSGWFKTIVLSKDQRIILKQNWKKGLVLARKKAVNWHNNEKEERIKLAKAEADLILGNIDFNNRHLLEVALAMLYLGEGFKKNSDTGIGNSDPLILKFFVIILLNMYNVKKDKLTCQLNLRADQNPSEMRTYWSKQLNLPLSAFRNIYLDQRTKGKPTYPNYKGVCIVRCGHVAVQRKLVYLSRKFCENVVEKLGG